MAKRPIFTPSNHGNLYEEKEIEFKWYSGFSVSQKQKSIKSLHENAKKEGYESILEVSTKSEIMLGQKLSAFNLEIDTEDYARISIESAFQGSKVFENGIQYIDIYQKKSIEAKKDERLKNSGRVIGFNFFGVEWDIEPKSAFYDWLYIKALQNHQEYLKKNLTKYQAFTDIEFNPKKSFSCQARTCAIIVSLLNLDLLDEAMSSQRNFKNIIYEKNLKKSQKTLF
jgi:hypothetical protein